MSDATISRDVFKSFFYQQSAAVDLTALEQAGVPATVIESINQAVGQDGVVDDHELDAVFNALQAVNPSTGSQLSLSGDVGVCVAVLSRQLPKATRQNIPVPQEVAATFLGYAADHGLTLDGKPFRVGTGYGQLAVASSGYEPQPDFGDQRMVLVMTDPRGEKTFVACNGFFRALFTRERDGQPLFEVVGQAVENEHGGGPGALQGFETGHQLQWHQGISWPACITLDDQELALLENPIDPRTYQLPETPPIVEPIEPSEITPESLAAIEQYLATHPNTGEKDGEAVAMGGGVAQRVINGHFGAEAVVVAAPGGAPGSAHLVMLGFYQQYKSDPEKFGQPLTDEFYPAPGTSQQEFTRGTMTWSAATGFEWTEKSVVPPVGPPPNPVATEQLRNVHAGDVLPDGSKILDVETLAAKIPEGGALQLGEITVTTGWEVIDEAEFSIHPTNGPNAKLNANGTPFVEGVGPHQKKLPTITFTNQDQTAVSFIRDGQMGGRLYRASFVGSDGESRQVLHNCGEHPKRTNWGPEFRDGNGNLVGTQGWPSFGGLEFCFGPNEHGTYNATQWETLIREHPDGEVSFITRTETVAGDTVTEPMRVALQTTLPATGNSFDMTAELENTGSQVIRPHVWFNFMLPAGTKDALYDIRVDMPTAKEGVEVHSSGDDDKHPYDRIPFSSSENFNGRDGWLGVFSRVLTQTYGVQNYGSPIESGNRYALQLETLAGPGMYPKVFALGRKMDSGIWDGNPDVAARRWYLEFWLSVNGNQNFDAQNGDPIPPGPDQAKVVAFRVNMADLV